MNRLKRTYFEVWGSEQAQNAFLKMLLLVGSALFGIQSFALVHLALKKPVLIAIGQETTSVLRYTPPPDQLLTQELKRAVSEYVLDHYNWDARSIGQEMARAENYVSDRFKQAFIQANAAQIQGAKEKNIQESAYISAINVDPKTFVANLGLDRILVVHSPGGDIRVATPLKLEVHFEYGRRTEDNPEGIYITSEVRSEPPQNQNRK